MHESKADQRNQNSQWKTVNFALISRGNKTCLLFDQEYATFPIPRHVKHPHTVTESPPCLTVGIMH